MFIFLWHLLYNYTHLLLYWITLNTPISSTNICFFLFCFLALICLFLDFSNMPIRIQNRAGFFNATITIHFEFLVKIYLFCLLFQGNSSMKLLCLLAVRDCCCGPHLDKCFNWKINIVTHFSALKISLLCIACTYAYVCIYYGTYPNARIHDLV